MELHGVTISETDNYVAAGDSGKYLDFLEEVMELRAAIHSLGNSPNPDLAHVKKLWEDNNGGYCDSSMNLQCHGCWFHSMTLYVHEQCTWLYMLHVICVLASSLTLIVIHNYHNSCNNNFIILSDTVAR